MIHELLEGEAFAAHAAMIGRKLGVPFNFDDRAISDMDEDTTATMATSTISPDYFFFD
jgi:phosphohistidine swiveling domain-containing protein